MVARTASRWAALLAASTMALAPAAPATAQEDGQEEQPDPYTVVLPEDFSVESLAESVAEAVAEAIAAEVAEGPVIDVVAEAAAPGDITVEAPDVTVEAPDVSVGGPGDVTGGDSEAVVDAVAEGIAESVPSDQLAEAIAEAVGEPVPPGQVADTVADAVADALIEGVGAGGPGGEGGDAGTAPASTLPDVAFDFPEEGFGAVPPVPGFPPEEGETGPAGLPGPDDGGIIEAVSPFAPEEGPSSPQGVPMPDGASPEDVAEAVTGAVGEPLPADQVDEVVTQAMPAQAGQAAPAAPTPGLVGGAAAAQPEGDKLPRTGLGTAPSLLGLAVALVAGGAGLLLAARWFVRGGTTRTRPSS